MNTVTNIQDSIKNKEKIHFIFDYDGLITPYMRTSASLFFSPMFKRVIENFAKKEFINVSLLTNKRIKTFKKECSISSENISIYGNFGAEKEINSIQSYNLDEEYKKFIKKLTSKIRKEIPNPKIIMENEDWSIILYTKNLSEADFKSLKKYLGETRKKYVNEIDLDIKFSQNKVELFNPAFSKINLIKNLETSNKDASFIYVGSDEDVFKQLSKLGGTSLKIINPGDPTDTSANIIMYKSKFEEFLADTNNLYI